MLRIFDAGMDIGEWLFEKNVPNRTHTRHLLACPVEGQFHFIAQ